MVPLPSFYDPEHVSSLFIERAGIIADEATSFRRAHGVRPSTEDKLKVAAFGIDVQVGFCVPGASLYVPNAVDDTRRTVEWLYRNLSKVTSLYFSLDTHHLFQVFHPAYWVDRNGEPPPPFTTIRVSDVRDGRFRPFFPGRLDEALEYVQKLEASGKYALTIWPYHALLGGLSHALVPAMMEAAIFHALVRGAETKLEIKGTSDVTENYSVMSPEVRELRGRPVGAFNQELFDALMAHDRVYVFGQAKSHCVLSTLLDMKERILATDPSLMAKIWILEDATSPVPPPPLDPLPESLDFPTIAARAFDELQEAGMHISRTTAPIEAEL